MLTPSAVTNAPHVRKNLEWAAPTTSQATHEKRLGQQQLPPLPALALEVHQHRGANADEHEEATQKPLGQRQEGVDGNHHPRSNENEGDEEKKAPRPHRRPRLDRPAALRRSCGPEP